jgi:signal transduction histidine kinase
MWSNRLALRLLVPAALVLLVATLATLQYRWLGQVSEAERERLHASLAQRAAEFADDFDREILRLYLALQVDAGPIDRGDLTAFTRNYDTWREAARFPEMLRAVYLADGNAPDRPPRRYDPETHALVTATWPDALKPVTERLAEARSSNVFKQNVTMAAVPPPPPPAPITAFSRGMEAAAAIEQLRHLVTARDPIMASVPALIVSLPTIAPTTGSGTQTMSFKVGTTVLVAELDGEYLASTVLPSLAERYFPERDADSYRFAVMDTTDRPHQVYARGLTDGAVIEQRSADASVPLFALRPDLAPQVAGRLWVTQPTMRTFTMPLGGAARSGQPGGAGASVSGTSLSILVESRGTSSNDVVKVNSAAGAAWQLRLQHTAGSLDAAVNSARRRNLWLSFGILTVLGAGVLLIVVNAQRWQRLAAQQMDFVATVTHELRTPLTVIRSAAQNLAAGVVHEAGQAKQYGELIETEGRRLTDMVEQVLEYAGLSGNRRLPTARPVDVHDLVREVAASCAVLCEAEHIDISVDLPDELPLIAADEGAVRRALQNLVTNAVKYGADGRWIGLAARRAGARGTSQDEVQISVSDRGRGIDAGDLAHIFEPFYRGRYAIDRQIHGNGLGLSLVQRIAEAHGGRVTVKSAPSEGATFTMHLPVARPDRVVDPLSEPASETGHPAV